MKILIVCPYFYPKTGGLENYVYSLCDGLIKNYHVEVVVITSGYSKDMKVEYQEKIKIFRLPVKFTISNTPVNPLWVFMIKKILDQEKPDIINAHAPVPFIADIACLLSQEIPFVLSYHGNSMRKESLIANSVILPYEKLVLPLMLKKAKKIITSSDNIRDTFLSSFKHKIQTITPSVDTSVFVPVPYKKGTTVCMVGGLKKAENHKGLVYLLHAIKEIKKVIPNVSLHLLGDGDASSEYREISKTLGITDNVHFLRKRERKKIVKDIQQSSVVVAPSLNESFGMSLIEAMACKKPVVGTKVGGIPFIIEDQINGLLVTPKNVKELVTAILFVLKNPDKARSMGENGYRKVTAEFSLNTMLKKTYDLYKSLL